MHASILLALILGTASIAIWPRLPPAFALHAALIVAFGLALRPSLRPLAGLMLGAALAGLAASPRLAAWAELGEQRHEFEFEARIVGLPDPGVPALRFEAEVVAGDGLPAGALIRLAWYGKSGATPQAGERWRLRARLGAPRGRVNPGGFDAERAALERGIVAVGTVRWGERVAPAATGSMQALRERLAEAIAELGAGDGSALLRALVVGDRRALDESLWDRLRATGTGHLMAISGLHVGLAAGLGAALGSLIVRFFPGLALILPRRHIGILLGLPAAVFYAALAGFAVPTRRALFMLAVVALALVARRVIAPFRILLLAAALVLVLDPLAVLGPSFWLSVAGVAILIAFVPVQHRPTLRLARAQAALSLAMMPLSGMWFGAIPLAGFIANLVAVPFVGAVSVPLGLIGALAELLLEGSGRWLLTAAAFSLQLLAGWLGLLTDFGPALWAVGKPSVMALVLAAIGTLLALAPRGVPGRWLGLPLFLPLLFPGAERIAPGTMTLRMLDVGQGTAVLVSTPDLVLLYDTGPRATDWDAGERIVVPALRALRVRRLDWIVVSHADVDHAGGLAAVRKAYPGARLIGSGIEDGEPCVAGARVTVGTTELRWLHPPASMPYLGNESSCVLRVDHAGGSLLLAGDIGKVIEGRLIRERTELLRADVVLVPHHGSRHSSSPDFIAASAARHALVSAGAGNPFGHPAPEVVARWQSAGAMVHSTACGMIELVYREERGWEGRAARRTHPRVWRRPCPARPSAGGVGLGGTAAIMAPLIRAKGSPNARALSRRRLDHVADPGLLHRCVRHRRRALLDPAPQRRTTPGARPRGPGLGAHGAGGAAAHRNPAPELAARGAARRGAGQPLAAARADQRAGGGRRSPHHPSPRAVPEHAGHHCRDQPPAGAARHGDRHDPPVPGDPGERSGRCHAACRRHR